jgi:hypothetical protein
MVPEIACVRQAPFQRQPPPHSAIGEAQCATGSERHISRWEHEAVLEKVQDRLDHNAAAMGVRRQTAEVLGCNMKRVMAIAGVGGLLEAMRA